MVMKPRRLRRRAEARSHGDVSKGLIVTPRSSMRTTSPSCGMRARVEFDALAELHEGRQAGNAAVGGGDLGDDARDADGGVRADRCGEARQRVEAVRGGGGRCERAHPVCPSVLMASCSELSEAVREADTISKARVTVMSRLISITALTLAFSM